MWKPICVKLACERAGIEKSANPHHFRHSRTIHVAKYLTEGQVRGCGDHDESPFRAAISIEIGTDSGEDFYTVGVGVVLVRLFDPDRGDWLPALRVSDVPMKSTENVPPYYAPLAERRSRRR